MILKKEFYLDLDVVAISKALLGKVLVTKIGEKHYTSGMIVETEAYKAPEDRASHAFNHRRTARTETMYCEGGTAYIYLCYGIHHLFNIVTGPINIPHAVLIRAIEPFDGIPTMLKRRHLETVKPSLTAGPGALTQALGITTKLDGVKLFSKPIWVEDINIKISPSEVIASRRVGVAYAKEHQHLPWRFRIKNNPWTSKAK